MSYFDSKKRVKSQKFFAIIATVSLFIVGTTYAGGGGSSGGSSGGGYLPSNPGDTAYSLNTYGSNSISNESQGTVANAQLGASLNGGTVTEAG